jgi:elongation factor Ts
MPTISAELIKKLRGLTGSSISLCKNALEEANGDLDAALEVLKKSSDVIAMKKGGRKTGAGVIDSYIHSTSRVGVLLELRCETDFVAKNPGFKSLAHEIALHVAGIGAETVEDVLSQPFVKDATITVSELIKKSIANFGENITLERFVRYEL